MDDKRKLELLRSIADGSIFNDPPSNEKPKGPESCGFSRNNGKPLDQDIFINAPKEVAYACPTFTGDFILTFDNNKKRVQMLENNNIYQNWGEIRRD